MASPSCPKCGKSHFGNQTTEVTGYNFRLNLIHCVACGSVVGVMPEHDPGAVGLHNRKIIEAVGKAVEKVEKAVKSRTR